MTRVMKGRDVLPPLISAVDFRFDPALLKCGAGFLMSAMHPGAEVNPNGHSRRDIVASLPRCSMANFRFPTIAEVRGLLV